MSRKEAFKRAFLGCLASSFVSDYYRAQVPRKRWPTVWRVTFPASLQRMVKR